MNKISLLIVDDHSVFRTGIIKVLEAEENILIAGEASDGSTAMELIPQIEPNIIILDIEMPGTNGIDTAREIKSKYPEIKIVILSMHLNPNFVFDALKTGIEGYVTKMSDIEEVINAINKVFEGGEYYSKDVSQFAMKNYQDYHAKNKPAPDSVTILTKREKEIIKNIVEGLSYKEIAKKLEISQYTVINHRQNIIQKLGFKNNAELIKYAISQNIG